MHNVNLSEKKDTFKLTAAQRLKRCGKVSSAPLDRIVQQVCTVRFKMYFRLQWQMLAFDAGCRTNNLYLQIFRLVPTMYFIKIIRMVSNL